jgi:hypothetical protein
MPNESDGAAAGELALHPATLPILAAGRTAITKRARAETRLERLDGRRSRTSESSEWILDWEVSTRWGEFARDWLFLSKWHDGAPRVSEEGLPAAVRILSVFCKEVECCDVRVAAKPAQGRIGVALDGQPLYASIREQFVDGERRAFPHGAVTAKTGSGRLVLIIEGAGASDLEIRDDGHGSIVDKIQRGIVERLRQRRAASEDWTRHREAGRAEQARVRAAEEEERRRQQTAREEAAAEHQRRDALADEAVRWDRAQLVRAYAEHVATKAGPDPSPELQKWIDWARRVVDDLEPPMPAAPVKDPN